MGGDAGGDDDGEDLLQFFDVFCFTEILVKAGSLFFRIFLKQDMPQLFVFLFIQLFDIACGSIIEILIELVLIVFQQSERFRIRDLAERADPVPDLTELAALQVRLKRHHLQGGF